MGLRNPDFPAVDRDQLRIDPGPRSIAGTDSSGPQYQFDTGTFLGKPVYLGELRTDGDGRLIFLGGRGLSETPFPHNTITTYADNRGWHDDMSDGPVTAKVTINGEEIPVDPAWVVVAPPNYAPEIIAIRTLYDVIVDAYQGLMMSPPKTVSYTRHIQPILQRFCEMQWVNFGFFLQFGWKSPYNFLRKEYMERLASKSPVSKEVRTQVFNLFRNPNATDLQLTAWPQTYGDYVEMPPTAPLSMLAVTTTQYSMLQKWVAGDFEEDWDPSQNEPPVSVDDVPLQERPATLDEAALHFCIGGPFHPGCEMTWPMRHYTMYYAPFRIRPRRPNQPVQDYGDVLTPEVATGENGPLYSNGPGDITRWMAVPWQTDSAGCRAGYTPEYDSYIPTFWPARVPNHVLTLEHFHQVSNAATLSLSDRTNAFNTRASWLRLLDGAVIAQMQQMTSDWYKAGVVVRKQLEPADPEFPSLMFVETEIGYHHKPPLEHNLTASPIGRVRKRRR